MTKLLVANCPVTVHEPQGEWLQLARSRLFLNEVKYNDFIVDSAGSTQIYPRILSFGNLREKMNPII